MSAHPTPEYQASYSPQRFTSLSVFAIILLILAVLGLAFVPLRGSQDEWWHLKTGQWIMQHGGLPQNDIFTYTGENLRWYNHEWLSQVLFYETYRFGELLGFQGISTVILLKSLVVAIAFLLVALLARQRRVAWPLACAIALIAADIARRTIHPRPPIFSYVLLAAFLLLLYGWKRGRVRLRTLWVLVPITVLWGNLHGMVLLAFLVSGAFAAGEALENLARWWNTRETDRRPFWSSIVTKPVLTLAALTAALVLAALAQPSGYHLFFLGGNFTDDPLLKNIILEMLPTPAPIFRLHSDLPWRFDNICGSPTRILDLLGGAGYHYNPAYPESHATALRR